MKTVDVIIPAYKPGTQFGGLLDRLRKQSVRPGRVIVINTQRELWESAQFDKSCFERETTDGVRYEVHHIAKEEFDHGGTRSMAARMSQADVLLFMTQDAMPADEHLIAHLLSAFADEEGNVRGGTVAAAYARQLPNDDCGFLERYTRSFNYGVQSLIKSSEDLPRLGVKTYFCSNVCAAYDRRIYEALGGFEKQTIFNEDMIFAARLIKAGYRIAYQAQAQVIHSHNYSGFQQFHRNFDLAVSQVQHPEIFDGIPSEGEGIRLVKSTAAWLVKSGRWYLLPVLIWQSGCKYLGYLLGRRYRKLPRRLVIWCSMNKKYWKDKNF